MFRSPGAGPGELRDPDEDKGEPGAGGAGPAAAGGLLPAAAAAALAEAVSASMAPQWAARRREAVGLPWLGREAGGSPRAAPKPSQKAWSAHREVWGEAGWLLASLLDAHPCLLFPEQEPAADAFVLRSCPLPYEQGPWRRNQQAALRQPAGGAAPAAQLQLGAQPGAHG